MFAENMRSKTSRRGLTVLVTFLYCSHYEYMLWCYIANTLLQRCGIASCANYKMLLCTVRAVVFAVPIPTPILIVMFDVSWRYSITSRRVSWTHSLIVTPCFIIAFIVSRVECKVAHNPTPPKNKETNFFSKSSSSQLRCKSSLIRIVRLRRECCWENKK